MNRDQEDAAVRRLAEAVKAAVMAELQRGTCPLVVLRTIAVHIGAYANGMTTGCGANPDAIQAILDNAITFGMHGGPPGREAIAS